VLISRELQVPEVCLIDSKLKRKRETWPWHGTIPVLSSERFTLSMQCPSSHCWRGTCCVELNSGVSDDREDVMQETKRNEIDKHAPIKPTME
jgi:hypothetical protein